jgi:hypothetical protein
LFSSIFLIMDNPRPFPEDGFTSLENVQTILSVSSDFLISLRCIEKTKEFCSNSNASISNTLWLIAFINKLLIKISDGKKQIHFDECIFASKPIYNVFANACSFKKKFNWFVIPPFKKNSGMLYCFHFW